MRGLFLVLVPLFPIRGLFLALPAILLSPKRCLYVNYTRFARIMRRPLWTGRQPLNAVGRYSFPMRPPQFHALKRLGGAV